MSGETTIAVVIPTRGRPDRLDAALETLGAQSTPVDEVVVVDDGEGEAEPVCARWVASLPVRYLRTGGRGAAGARNCGILASRSEWVAFMDDDCGWHPDRAGALRSAMRHDVGYLYSPCVVIGTSGTAILHGRPPSDRSFTGPWRVGTPSMIVRRSVLLAIGMFDEALPRHQDFDLAIRVMSATTASWVPGALVWADDIPGISTNVEARLAAVRAISRKYSFALCRRDRANMHRALAHNLLLAGLWAPGRQQYLLAFCAEPLAPRNWVSLLAVAGGARFHRFAVRIIESYRLKRYGTVEVVH